MSILDGLVTQLLTADNLKDFKHANRLFVGDNFRLSPKMGFLYHVFFEVDPSICRMSNINQLEAGMMVKSIDLPKFTIDTKTLNSYNKPNIVQTKIKYDSLNISFHDDNADVIRNLWFDYYHYYYRDADLGYADKSGIVNPNYFIPTKYGDRTNNNFGYTPRNYSVFTDNLVQQFIKSIRIYSLHKKRFSEYTLINPTITSFKHGQHQAGSNEPMGHDMTISYEFVLYAAGNVSKNTVKGFADLHYDTTPSPLSVAGGGTKTLLGPGGIFDTADDVIEDLSKDPPNYAAALFKGFRGVNNLKNMNLKNAAKAEFGQLSMDVLKGDNPLNKVNIPTLAGLGVAAGAAAVVALTSSNKSTTDNKVSKTAITSNGAGVGAAATAATNGTSLKGPAAAVAGGSSDSTKTLPTNATGQLTGSNDLNKLVTVSPVTGAASSAGLLSPTTPAQRKIQSIPGYSANQAADIYITNNGASAGVLEEAASSAASINIANSRENAIARTTNLARSTSTPPSPVSITLAEVQAVSITTQTTTTTASGTTTAVTNNYTGINAKLAILKANPNATLNDLNDLVVPTNQGKVG